MAIRTLDNVAEINGHRVFHGDNLNSLRGGVFSGRHVEYPYVSVLRDIHTLVVTMQEGAVKHAGVNGCQVDDLVEIARIMLMGVDRETPCHHNQLAIASLNNAIYWLEQRKRDREARGVEGTPQE